MGLFGLGKGGGSDEGADNKDVKDGGKPTTAEGIVDGKDKANESGKNSGKEKGKEGADLNDDKVKDNQPNIEEIIQNAITEATKGLKADNDALKSQVADLMRKGLTPEQIKELDEREKTAAQNKREADITERENRFYALTAIKEAGLDDGGKTALELIDLVMGKDQKEIDAKVKSLGKLIKKMVSTEVEKTFKDHGRSPESGKGADGEDQKNDIAKRLGQRTAKLNEQARKTLDFYLGGNK